ncbi:putative glutaredoxin-C2 [Lolium perenne]|uniref:putative glutaredoxin-C2 n=1 Tax=Lolium perenne TaxID=4522 RepID=UPI0021F58226|nr:putative glutaredoxin-C2 [Lolium perenne]
MAAGRVRGLASQRVVVIVGASNCCMCHTVQTLFMELGVSWTMTPGARTSRGRSLTWSAGVCLSRPSSSESQSSATTDWVMLLHLGGQLVPLLRQAGALWL